MHDHGIDGDIAITIRPGGRFTCWKNTKPSSAIEVISLRPLARFSRGARPKATEKIL